jgi:hypothetical protein
MNDNQDKIYVLTESASPTAFDQWEDIRERLADGRIKLSDSWWGIRQIESSTYENYRWFRFDERCPRTSDGIDERGMTLVGAQTGWPSYLAQFDQKAVRRALALTSILLSSDRGNEKSDWYIQVNRFTKTLLSYLPPGDILVLIRNIELLREYGSVLCFSESDALRVLSMAFYEMGLPLEIEHDKLSDSSYARLNREDELLLHITSIAVRLYNDRYIETKLYRERNPVHISGRRFRREPYVLRAPNELNPYLDLWNGDIRPPPVPGTTEQEDFSEKQKLYEQWIGIQQERVRRLEQRCDGDRAKLWRLHSQINKDGHVTDLTWLNLYSTAQKVLFGTFLLWMISSFIFLKPKP